MLAFPFLRKRLEEIGVRPEKIHDCYPVVNVPLFMDRSPNRKGVMNIGAALPKKQMDDFFLLASQVPGQRFTLYAMGGTEELRERNRASVTPSPCTLP